jgi:hypothetical protein
MMCLEVGKLVDFLDSSPIHLKEGKKEARRRRRTGDNGELVEGIYEMNQLRSLIVSCLYFFRTIHVVSALCKFL